MRADVLEISPQVVEASRFFDDENHRALDDPRTRAHRRRRPHAPVLTREQYDVIVSEPSNPWMAGIASLFTREFFEAARARLEAGRRALPVGAHLRHQHARPAVDCRHVPVGVSRRHAVAGRRRRRAAGRIERAARAATGEHRRPRGSGPASPRIWPSSARSSRFMCCRCSSRTARQLAEWAAGAPVQSDNRAALEFSGPQSIFGRYRLGQRHTLAQLAAKPGRARPPSTPVRAAATADAYPRSRLDAAPGRRVPARLRRISCVPWRSTRTTHAPSKALIRASAPLQRSADTRAAAQPPGRGSRRDDATKLALSRLLAAEGAYDEAVAHHLRDSPGRPGNVAALEQLASVLSDVGDVERMRPVVARLRAEAPASEAAHYYSAALLFMENRIDLALTEARRVLAINPSHAKAHNLMGACLASLGQRDQARTAFQASLRADPRDPATYTNLATLERRPAIATWRATSPKR